MEYKKDIPDIEGTALNLAKATAAAVSLLVAATLELFENSKGKKRKFFSEIKGYALPDGWRNHFRQIVEIARIPMHTSFAASVKPKALKSVSKKKRTKNSTLYFQKNFSRNCCNFFGLILP